MPTAHVLKKVTGLSVKRKTEKGRQQTEGDTEDDSNNSLMVSGGEKRQPGQPAPVIRLTHRTLFPLIQEIFYTNDRFLQPGSITS